MKKLTVPKIQIETESFNYYTISQQLQALPWHPIDQVNWPKEYPYKPLVVFQIAHNDAYIYLHYSVEEEFIKAEFIRPNESVWEDSCVEFFISFDNRKHYYNLEFNVLGTGLIGVGSEIKTERERLSEAEILTVQSATSVVNAGGKKIWSMVLAIPTAIFAQPNQGKLSGTKAHANFYKCGDKLPTPHFISWNKINYPSPNFHLPEFFGEIEFI